MEWVCWSFSLPKAKRTATRTARITVFARRLDIVPFSITVPFISGILAAGHPKAVRTRMYLIQ
jgi:hypothetical protein